MTRNSLLAVLAVLALGGCSSGSNDAAATTADSGPADTLSGDAPADVATDAMPDAQADVRGQRYCEILLGTVSGTNLHVDVYNTWGLNDCPDATWSAIDTAAVKTDTKSDVVVLNGPRYWLIDSFGSSKLLDGTVRVVGGLEMRLAGGIDVATADLAKLQAPYTQHTIRRDTQFVFGKGKLVYELLDDAGHVYTMQSWSVQTKPQTEASLAALGSDLKLPAGWTFRTRTLDAELVVTAVSGTATVVQDGNGDTYLMSK